MTVAGDGDGPGRSQSLAGQAGGAFRRRLARIPCPSGYRPALAVLAAIPGVIAALAIGLASIGAYRNDGLSRAASSRIAAIADMRRNADHRTAMAPYLATPTLTAALAEAVALLPADAVLTAIARDRAGVTRIEVDCPDPDALLRAFRPPASRLAWRSVAQSVTGGAGVRVTLEAPAR